MKYLYKIGDYVRVHHYIFGDMNGTVTKRHCVPAHHYEVLLRGGAKLWFCEKQQAGDYGRHIICLVEAKNMPNEFISGEAAIKLAKEYPEDTGSGLCEIAIPVEDIERMTAADVVPVARCKDCEQYVAGEIGYGKCNFFKTAIFSEFYCRYGGKKGRAERVS